MLGRRLELSRAGTSTVAFDLFLEPKAYFIHEWRTTGNPYATGPVLAIVFVGVVIVVAGIAA